MGPVEGVGHGRVVVGNEPSGLGLEVGDRGGVTAAQALSWGDAEGDLDLVKPRAVFGQVDEAVADVREELAPSRQRSFVTSLPHNRGLGGIHEYPISWNSISALWH